MIRTQLTTDKFAMSLSMICLIHCLFAPSFIILTSAFLSFSYDNEFMHKMILLLAVPISIFALIMGYKNHKTISFLLIGILGLLILILAVLLGERMLGEYGEKGLTLMGTIFVTYSHYKNHQVCINLDCSCHEE
jgi:hypothetical protein|tara:strand:+ start:5571 stop:5972 length:402 start_codon:yes stop_codon:yes gene_type:complete